MFQWFKTNVHERIEISKYLKSFFVPLFKRTKIITGDPDIMPELLYIHCVCVYV